MGGSFGEAFGPVLALMGVFGAVAALGSFVGVTHFICRPPDHPWLRTVGVAGVFLFGAATVFKLASLMGRSLGGREPVVPALVFAALCLVPAFKLATLTTWPRAALATVVVYAMVGLGALIAVASFR